MRDSGVSIAAREWVSVLTERSEIRMGSFHYDVGFSADFEDRLLAHLQIVIGAKLRRGEGFYFSWRDETGAQRFGSTPPSHFATSTTAAGCRASTRHGFGICRSRRIRPAVCSSFPNPRRPSPRRARKTHRADGADTGPCISAVHRAEPRPQ
jgi:hypothetical protein